MDNGFDEPTDIVFTPDGYYAYIANCGKNSAISKLDTVTNQVTTTIKLREYLCPKALAMSPDGSKVYIATGYDIEPIYKEMAVLVLDTSSNR